MAHTTLSKQLLISVFLSEVETASTSDPTFQYRQKALLKVVDSLRVYPNAEITREQFQQLSGVGKGSLDRFDNLARGMYIAAPCATETPVNISDEEKLMALFEGIYGVGKVKAADLIRKGYRSLGEIPPNELTQNQQLGVQYYREINSRIPRKDIIAFEQMLFSVVPFDCRFLICGSYLRGKPDSGDVDIIVSDAVVIDMLIDTGCIRHVLSKGNSKCLTLALVNKTVRRVDFEIVQDNSWPYAQLYFTGSAEFNKRCRQRAKDLGYTLNEKGLFSIATGQQYVQQNITEEHQIFQLLGMQYIPPRER